MIITEVKWEIHDPRLHPYDLRLLTPMLNENNPAPAREQLDAGYRHGGGWCPFEGFKLLPNDSLVYPGDPPVRPMASATLRDEKIVLYECSWVAIIQPDRSFEVCRMD